MYIVFTVFSNTLILSSYRDSQELRAAGPAMTAVTGSIFKHMPSPHPVHPPRRFPAPQALTHIPGTDEGIEHPIPKQRDLESHFGHRREANPFHHLVQVNTNKSQASSLPQATRPLPTKQMHSIQAPSVAGSKTGHPFIPLFFPVMYKKTSTHHHHYHRFAPTPPPMTPHYPGLVLLLLFLSSAQPQRSSHDDALPLLLFPNLAPRDPLPGARPAPPGALEVLQPLSRLGEVLGCKSHSSSAHTPHQPAQR